MSTSPLPAPDACPYTAYFCEENAWLLCRKLVHCGLLPGDIQVLLFSNQQNSVLLQQQRAAATGQPMIWDYHVVVRVTGETDQVLDPDSRLPMPCATDRYLQQTFGRQARLPESLRTQVRVIPAASYLARFHSDRSHMEQALPLSAFPGYPCIEAPAAVRIDLAEYRNLDRHLDDGSRVLTIDAFNGSRYRAGQSIL